MSPSVVAANAAEAMSHDPIRGDEILVIA